MGVITNKKRIAEIFDRGIIKEVLPVQNDLLKKMLSGERLRIYIGFDPTSPALHLSHAKNLMLLEEFRQLGHEAIFLVGDFTARIGDPSERSGARKRMSKAEVEKNVKAWIPQIKNLLDFNDKKNPPRLVYNSQWLSKLSLEEVIELAAYFTVQQMVKRDMFEKRIKENIPIHLNEFLYPLMQGYDSVALDTDIELCGTDQIFNALAGRTLLGRLKNKEKFVVAVNLMENPKTGELMSKSRGTGVFLSSLPEEMYGAIMAQPDEMIEVLLVNCTRVPLNEIKNILRTGPRQAKAKVAFEIVKKIHDEKAARLAQEHFEKVFSKKEIPSDLPELVLKTRTMTALDLVLASGVVGSKSDARRLIEQGGFDINGETKKKPQEDILLAGGEVVRLGKRHLFRLKIR
ncbi:MAG: tyrosine--tRNA ligase [Minisyncoccia bacterium]|jgi:tyrosyl-tRNA synthetase